MSSKKQMKSKVMLVMVANVGIHVYSVTVLAHAVKSVSNIILSRVVLCFQ